MSKRKRGKAKKPPMTPQRFMQLLASLPQDASLKEKTSLLLPHLTIPEEDTEGNWRQTLMLCRMFKIPVRVELAFEASSPNAGRFLELSYDPETDTESERWLDH